MKQYLKIDTEKIFTWFIFELMKKRKSFVVFENNNQILSDREYKKWIWDNGYFDDTPRIMYQSLSDGYTIKRMGYALHLTVPNDLLELKYEQFMESI